MPEGNIGEPNNLDRKQFLELKSKDETVRIRFASPKYVYEGLHFLSQAGSDKKTVSHCPRINNDEPCVHCNKYFELSRAARNIEKEADRKKALEDAKKAYGVSLIFYYKVLNRTTGLAAILKTKLTVRIQLEEYAAKGIDVGTVDFDLTRTEKPGIYYELDRVDSAEIKKLTKDEQDELTKAGQIDLAQIINGKQSSLEPDEAEIL